jgi:hypothetical protein
MNTHEMTINAVELASELAAAQLERVYANQLIIWEEVDEIQTYTEDAQYIFNDLYDEYYTLIESTKI